MGLGDLICETDRGRPLATSEERLDEDEDFVEDELLCEDEEWRDELLDEDDEDEEDEDLEDDLATSRMFRERPVVGSTVEASAGLWAQW
jgi:chromatin segregation and condensation protein Rec8/ScpA/Scc1 (kleisin family)